MYDAVERNVRATWLLFAFFIVVAGVLGYAFGESVEFGYGGVVMAALVAGAASWFSYYYSDAVVLSLSRARPASREQYPYLHNTIEGLALAAGIPAPRVYVIEDGAPNAFATGRDPDHAVVAVTTGLLDKLNRLELEGVLAHEIAHVQNYDIRLATIAAVLVGVIALLSDWLLRSMRWGRRRGGRDSGAGGVLVLVGLVLAIVAPLVAQLLRLAIARRREFLADASAALLTRYPEGLASALEKISADPDPLDAANKATAHMYIINPLREWGGWTNNLFNTHPPVEERVQRLRGMLLQGLGGSPTTSEK